MAMYVKCWSNTLIRVNTDKDPLGGPPRRESSPRPRSHKRTVGLKKPTLLRQRPYNSTDMIFFLCLMNEIEHSHLKKKFFKNNYITTDNFAKDKVNLKLILSECRRRKLSS